MKEKYKLEVIVTGDADLAEIVDTDGVKSVMNINQFIQDTKHSKKERSHKFSEGDFALDKAEPTPSPEANTVKIVETFNQRADAFIIEETGKTVAEHIDIYGSPDDLVVAGVYPNMGGDKVWHFPESRLREV